MSFVYKEGGLQLEGDRIDWTKEYHERERHQKLYEKELEERSKQKSNESSKDKNINMEKYTLQQCPPYGSKVFREDDIALYKKIREEVEKDFTPEVYETDYRSVTKVDFYTQELPERPRPEPRICELAHEQPVTFWTEHRDCMPGNTQVGLSNKTPFGRNAAFTTPIDQYLRAPMPGEMPAYQR
ncbi:hypothetical protein PHET_06440 [Paragonimus heterotremus]|uniref:Uncharacterized protein n=1 Tax=Paragonimus heterotremus TaxID=100268 RepID=A0A8J4WZD4_9TREM|nr:hypothetical protein PHET_06440 [Paragonimus heterotremus]